MTIATYYLLLLATAIALAIPVLNSATDESVVRTEPGLRLRLISAGWFALTACVPVGLFWAVVFLVDRDPMKAQTTLMPALVWIFGGLPIVAAALCGFTRGVLILDPLKV